MLARAAAAFVLASSLALASACSGLHVDAAAPNPVAPGGTLEVQGGGFAAGLELSLDGGGVAVQLQAVQVDADGAGARAVLPQKTPEGRYTLTARLGGASAQLDGIDVRVAGLRALFLDIGQGDATLVVSPTGESLLIDGGPRDHADVVRAAIAEHARGRLDAVVLTHTDADHLGGLVEVLAGDDGIPGTNDDLVPQQRFSGRDDGACTSQLCDDARALLSWPFVVPEVGRAIALGAGVTATIVSVDGDVGAGVVDGVSDENEKSLAVHLVFGGRTLLVLGDLTGGGDGEANVEEPLAQRTGPVDVLRTAHHGSSTSSNAAALALWQARALVASLGTDNAFCHPAGDALGRWASTGAPIYATGAGMIDDADRCSDGATDWPPQARDGLGTIVLDVGLDGTLTLDGDTL